GEGAGDAVGREEQVALLASQLGIQLQRELRVPLHHRLGGGLVGSERAHGDESAEGEGQQTLHGWVLRNGQARAARAWPSKTRHKRPVLRSRSSGRGRGWSRCAYRGSGTGTGGRPRSAGGSAPRSAWR